MHGSNPHPPPPEEYAYRRFDRKSLIFVSDGIKSPQVHVQDDENHFEIVGPPFSNTSREFRRLLYRIGCKYKGLWTDFEKLSIFSISSQYRKITA